MKIETDDTVVEGSGRETNFAWQAEAEIQYELTKHFTLRLGYRYIDMGNIVASLTSISEGYVKVL